MFFNRMFGWLRASSEELFDLLLDLKYFLKKLVYFIPSSVCYVLSMLMQWNSSRGKLNSIACLLILFINIFLLSLN